MFPSLPRRAVNGAGLGIASKQSGQNAPIAPLHHAASCKTRHFITEMALCAKMFYGCFYKIQFKLQFILSSSLQIDDRHFQLTLGPCETLVHFAASSLSQSVCCSADPALRGCGCHRDQRATAFVSLVPPQPQRSTAGPAAPTVFQCPPCPHESHT